MTWYINGAIVDLKRSVDIRGWFADDCMNCRTKKHQGGMCGKTVSVGAAGSRILTAVNTKWRYWYV